MSLSPWKKISSKVAYENPWFRVLHDNVIRPDGAEGVYNVVETHGDSVFVVPLTENNEIYLLELYRYPTNVLSIEVPGGNSDGQDLLEAAKRELKEETGLVATDWKQVGSWQTMNGVTNEMSHAFVARGLTQTPSHGQTEEGITRVMHASVEEVNTMIDQKEITDGQSILALYFAFRSLNL